MRRNRRSWFSLGSGAVPKVAGGGAAAAAAGGAAMVVPAVLDLRTTLMSEDTSPSLQIRSTFVLIILFFFFPFSLAGNTKTLSQP